MARLGCLTWGSEPLQQWDYFIDTAVLQFVGCPLGKYGVSFYCDKMFCLIAASPLSLDVGFLFFMGSRVLLSVVVEQLVVILVLSKEEVNAGSSTLPS